MDTPVTETAVIMATGRLEALLIRAVRMEVLPTFA